MGAAARPLSERVVLVVDDEEAVCRLTARMLTHAGFHVLEAHSGAEAVALLSTLDGTVQLVLSDVAMPKMSGTELAVFMAGRYPQTPILLMSGQGGPAADYPGPFLPKPFTADDLLDAVGRLLAHTHQPGRV
jgi:two-component system cell cycle sensor histidine kinase/response regulator CckA